MPGKLVACLLACVVLACAAAREAQARDEEWFKVVGPRAWLINYDPTSLSSRLDSETSYEQDRGGDHTVEMKNQVRLAGTPLDGPWMELRPITVWRLA